MDFGRKVPPSNQIPKLVSGLDDIVPGSLQEIKRLYQTVFSQVVPVSKPEVAEMTKLYENGQRMVGIAYANEMADAALCQGINPFEISAAAATKPFGYLPLDPGLGVGGHCLPVNAQYLLSTCAMPLLRAATESMANRPAAISTSIMERICPTPIQKYFRVLIVGIAFKPGQSRLENSPALELARRISSNDHAHVFFADDKVSEINSPGIQYFPEEKWTIEELSKFDFIVLASRQTRYDTSLLRSLSGVEIEHWCDLGKNSISSVMP
jgi:nucleotide sugar dehydrogenase